MCRFVKKKEREREREREKQEDEQRCVGGVYHKRYFAYITSYLTC